MTFKQNMHAHSEDENGKKVLTKDSVITIKTGQMYVCGKKCGLGKEKLFENFFRVTI